MVPLPFQLASHGKRLPSGREWTFERKYDGYRAQVVAKGGEVRVFTRGGHDWTRRFPGIVDAARALEGDFVLDGEICALTGDGRTSFSWLGDPQVHDARLIFQAFDILSLRGVDLRHRSLSVRREVSVKFLEPATNGVMFRVVGEDDEGKSLLERTRIDGHEGIIAKRLDASYRGRRTNDWLKFKNRKTETFMVIGWHEDESHQLTSLLLASTDLVPHFRGRVGTGFSVAERGTLRELLRHNAATRSYLNVATPLQVGRSAQWVDAPLLARVEYLELSSGGMLREPSFLGLL